jgi:hypothetical protein
MSLRTMISMASVCVILGACGTLPQHEPPYGRARVKDPSCDGTKKCEIFVTVTCPDGAAECTASVDPKVVVILGRGHVQHINWTLKGVPGYQFADQGIVIDDPDISCGPLGNQTTTFKCTDNHSRLAVIPYLVNIKAEGSAKPVGSVDPWIVNN